MGMHTHAQVQVCTYLPALERMHRQTRVHTYLHTHTYVHSYALLFCVSLAHRNTPTLVHLCTFTGVQTCGYPQVPSPISTHTHKHTATLPMHIHNHADAHTQAYTAYTCVHRCGQTRASYRCAPTQVHQQRWAHSGLLKTTAYLIPGTPLGRWGPSECCIGLCSCWARDRTPQVPCATLRHT